MKPSDVEAIYQTYIIRKAFEQANKDNEQLRFDPQGHALLDLKLTDEDYSAVLNALEAWVDYNEPDIRIDIPADQAQSKAILERYLGSKVTQTTLCNIDTLGTRLHEGFIQWLTDYEKISDNALRLSAINTAKETLFSADHPSNKHRGSIIALSQELEMHMRLKLRVFKKYSSNMIIDDDEWQEMCAEAYQSLNQLSRHAFIEALEVSMVDKNDGPAIDIAKLNKALDGARKDLAKQCNTIIADTIAKHIYTDTDEHYVDVTDLINKYFESTTATGQDYLHTSIAGQSITRITATEETAHNKRPGSETIALREVRHNHLSLDGIVTTPQDSWVSMRAPSIAISKGSANIPQDTRDKLAYIHNTVSAARGDDDSSKPVIYNLLTSIPGGILRFFDKGQRKSAHHILQGAHMHNNELMKNDDNNSGLILVQNIPTNQHSQDLSKYRSSLLGDMLRFFYSLFAGKEANNLLTEATLMAEIALLHTLSNQLPKNEPLKEHYNNVISFYRKFLQQMPAGGAVYFSGSAQGKACIEYLKVMKKTPPERSLPHPGGLPTTRELAAQALQRLYFSSNFHKTQFGMLIQSLSIFIQPATVYGCKSGNERSQSVAGRVDMLQTMLLKEEKGVDLLPEEHRLKEALDSFAEGNIPAAQLQQAIDESYNALNLQGAVSQISLEDQGGPSKVIKTKASGGKITEINTNVAETGWLTHLSQKNASKLQSHKGDKAGDLQRAMNGGVMKIRAKHDEEIAILPTVKIDHGHDLVINEHDLRSEHGDPHPEHHTGPAVTGKSHRRP